MYALKSEYYTPMPWLILAKALVLLIVLAQEAKGFPIYPTSKAWMCNSENVIYNSTLQGGIHSGKFRKLGVIKNMDTCTRHCCDDRKCDVAFMAKQNCYLVTCENKFLCSPVPTASPKLYPRLAYVTKTYFKDKDVSKTAPNQVADDSKYQGFGDVGDDELRQHLQSGDDAAKSLLSKLDATTSSTLQQSLLKYDNSLQAAKNDKKDRIETNSDSETSVYSSGCFPAKIHKGVSLRYGTHSGEFYDYGEIGDMRMCVDLCCKDKKCDVAFMVGKTCYTISCSSFDFCQMVPSSKQPNLSTQLAYVIKRRSADSKKKLLISQNHEKFLNHQISSKASKKTTAGQPHLHSGGSHSHAESPHMHPQEFSFSEKGTPKSDIFSSDEPNVPKKFTKGCRNNRILRDYGLIGGQRAGVYTFRGITPDFDSCIGLCCSEMMCDAALLLGRKCFSVQCFKNGACAGRPATTHGLRSKLAFVERKDEDIGEKRTSIPGLLPTDRQYTVYMNITSEDFKEGLRDRESLEFLNFAQALRTAVTGILGNVEGFKYIEILKFKPNKVLAVFNITTDQKTHPKVLLQLLVDSMRKGELKTYDQTLQGKLTLDVRGFKFYNAKGDDLVCSPEFNYDAHWPLAIFGTSVNIPCPRDAAGLTNRKCKGGDDELAKWDIPDFSDCVSQKYEDLFKEAQLLNSASVHSPELTPASIIDRLLQLTTADTYGSSPPTAQRRHGNIQSRFRYQNQHTAYKPPQIPVGRESLHSPQIDNLRKLVAEKMKQSSKTVPKYPNTIENQKQRPKINLLPFFRGPTAKNIKINAQVFPTTKQNNLKIASVNIVPNRLSGNVPKQVQSNNRLSAGSIPNQVPANNRLQSGSVQNQVASNNLVSPQSPLQFGKQGPYASLLNSPLFNQGSFQGQKLQTQPQSLAAHNNQQPARLVSNQGPDRSLPSQGMPNLRNLERAFSPDYRKFNGNAKVDPTLLLSEAHWSKPEKIQPKPRSAPSQAQLGQTKAQHNQDYPGHVFHTISLPAQNSPPVPQPAWDFSRKLPVRNSPPLVSSTGQKGSMKNNPDQLFVSPAVHELNHQLNSPLAGQQDNGLNAYQQNFASQKQTPNNRKDFVVSIKRRSLDDEPIYNSKKAEVSREVKMLGFDSRDEMKGGLDDSERYMANIKRQVFGYGSFHTANNATLDMSQPHNDFGSNVRTTSQNDGKYFTAKTRSLSDSQDAAVDKSPSKSDIEALGFDPGIIRKSVEKRDILNDYKSAADGENQASVLESLVDDDSDGDDNSGTHKPLNIVPPATSQPKVVQISGEAKKSSIDSPTMAAVKKKDEIMKMLQDNVIKMAEHSKPEPFKLIEKASYRPNDDDNEEDVKKFDKPIIVNLPPTSPFSSSIINSIHTSKSHQGTSFDLAESQGKLNGETPADPRETSSYTEAHLDNPAINAIASSKILHDDNAAGNGNAISNIEITGVQGQPSSNLAPQPQSQEVPQPQSQPQNQEVTQNQGSSLQPPSHETAPQGNVQEQAPGSESPKPSGNENQGSVEAPTEPYNPEVMPPKQNESTDGGKMMPIPTIPPTEEDSRVKGVSENVDQGNISTDNNSKVEEKPDEPEGPTETVKHKEDEKIPLVPLQDFTPTQSNIPVVANQPYNENEVKIPEVVLKKLTVNVTEEKPVKSGASDSGLVFAYDTEHGMNRSAMFGGDILLSADIIEEISNYMQRQTEAPSPQEVKEFLEAASALLDENNAHEWKNAQRHMKVIANEGDVSNGEVDVQDWRSLHKMQSKRRPNILMEFVDDIEVYGKAAARMITKYNPVLQKPVITPNILMQFRVVIVEDLDDRPGNMISFPNYTNPDIAKWMTSQDQISLPASLIAETIQPTAMIHITFFLFKTVYKLQRFQEDMDEDDEQEILDENPMKVGSELISMSVDPPLPGSLSAPVTISLQKSGYDSKAQHECAFWNSTTNDWSTKGCKLVSFNDTHATCECNHLTMYGILVDSSKPQAPIPPDFGGGSKKPPGGEPPSSEANKPVDKPPENLSPATAPAPPPQPPKVPPSKAPPSEVSTTKEPGETSDKKNNILFWLLICLVILLVILLLCLCCLFCWLRRRKKEEKTKTKETGSSSGSGTSVGSELLHDKSKLPPKREPSPSPGRSVSPLPRDSPGWLKLKSHADHRREMLMREKALLFSDYHQPYHFLSGEKERPNTSLESVYGGSEAPTPKPSSSSSSSRGTDKTLPRKKPEHGRSNRSAPRERRPKAPVRDRPADKKPRDVRRKEIPLQRGDSEQKPSGPKDPGPRDSGPKKRPNGDVPNGNGRPPPKSGSETGPMPMEWDPYYLNTKKNEEEKKKPDKKLNGARKKSRNFSPISEEDSAGQESQDSDKPIDSIAPQVGSDINEPGQVSESLYPISSSDPSEEGVNAGTINSNTENPRTSSSRNRSPPGAKQTRNQTTQASGKR